LRKDDIGLEGREINQPIGTRRIDTLRRLTRVDVPAGLIGTKGVVYVLNDHDHLFGIGGPIHGIKE
jgi:hypothetical protein